MSMLTDISRFLFAPSPKVGEIYIVADDADDPFNLDVEQIRIQEIRGNWVQYEYVHGFRKFKKGSDRLRDILIIYRKLDVPS